MSLPDFFAVADSSDQNKFDSDSVQSIWFQRCDKFILQCCVTILFSFTVSGLYDPKSHVIAEVLAQECCLHNFNQFDLSQSTQSTFNSIAHGI